jgi:uncharacterized protein YdaL
MHLKIAVAVPHARRARVTGLALALALVLSLSFAAQPSAHAADSRAATTPSILVLYDSTGAYGWLGEMYAEQAANLASHFGTWRAHPVSTYTAGELTSYAAVIYVGSTYEEPLPAAFLDDVLASSVKVLWMNDNIWQLQARAGAKWAATYGFTPGYFDFSTVQQVTYAGRSLTRDTLNAGGILNVTVSDAARASVLAQAVRADGTTLPWATRSGNLTYLGEIPFSYTSMNDRYLAFADLLFDLLAPATAARHRALVRIEDVGPDADPADLRAVADYLWSQHVPFSVAVYPVYKDPLGVQHSGKATTTTLWQKPSVVSALRYLVSHGGTLIMHGYTHQYGSVANPYDGVSANDFEFYRAHVDANDYVVLDGPVAEDSRSWALGRIDASFSQFALAALPRPAIFEFPHYAGSDADYRASASRFAVRYERSLYFPGQLSGKAIDYTRPNGQFFPYLVHDLYGQTVIPENIGNVELEEQNHHPPRYPADIVASAERNLVVRDGFASFFYHPYLGTSYLKQVVTGIKGLGYTFSSAQGVLTG